MSTAVSNPWPDTLLAGQRTLVQIDGFYLSALASAVGFALDFRAFHRSLSTATHLLRATYYVDLVHGDDNICRLTDWLEYNGYLVSIRTRHRDESALGAYVAMAVDAVSQLSHYNHLVIVSGNRALLPVIRAVRNSGPQVTIIGTLRKGSAEVSDKIRRSADHFIDAVQLQHLALQRKAAANSDETAPGAVTD